MKNPVALTLRVERDLYETSRKVAKAKGMSFTHFVKSLIEEKLREEERRRLHDAFSLVAEDKEEVDVAFALHAQHEVVKGG